MTRSREQALDMSPMQWMNAPDRQEDQICLDGRSYKDDWVSGIWGNPRTVWGITRNNTDIPPGGAGKEAVFQTVKSRANIKHHRGFGFNFVLVRQKDEPL